jgi:hypothetical protein
MIPSPPDKKKDEKYLSHTEWHCCVVLRHSRSSPARSRKVGRSGYVNPMLNVHPRPSTPFLEPRYLARDRNAFALRAMLDDERRSTRLRGFGINPALNVTTIALKEDRADHVRSPAR